MLMLKTILSLFPFFKEIVESLQRGPRERRTKNPLAPWLVICLIFMLAAGVIASQHLLDLMEEIRVLSLDRATAKHQVELLERVKSENTKLSEELGETQAQLNYANRQNTEVTEARDKLQKTNNELAQRLVTETAANAELKVTNEALTVQIMTAEKCIAAKTLVKVPGTPKPKTDTPSDRAKLMLYELIGY